MLCNSDMYVYVMDYHDVDNYTGSVLLPVIYRMVGGVPEAPQLS